MTPSHALEVGQRVLAVLLQGRTQVNLARQARGTQLANQVRYLVLADQQAELPARVDAPGGYDGRWGGRFQKATSGK